MQHHRRVFILGFLAMLLAAQLALPAPGMASTSLTDLTDADLRCQRTIGRVGRDLADDVLDVEKCLDKALMAIRSGEPRKIDRARNECQEAFKEVYEASSKVIDRIQNRCDVNNIFALGFGDDLPVGSGSESEPIILAAFASLICQTKALLASAQLIIEYPLAPVILAELGFTSISSEHEVVENVLDERCFLAPEDGI